MSDYAPRNRVTALASRGLKAAERGTLKEVLRVSERGRTVVTRRRPRPTTRPVDGPTILRAASQVTTR